MMKGFSTSCPQRKLFITVELFLNVQCMIYLAKLAPTVQYSVHT